MSNHTIQEAAFVKEARVHVNESLTIPETVPGGWVCLQILQDRNAVTTKQSKNTQSKNTHSVLRALCRDAKVRVMKKGMAWNCTLSVRDRDTLQLRTFCMFLTAV
eukprot:383018-Rhodomonas_salina.1